MPHPRKLALSASGRFVAVRRAAAIEVVDVQGTAPRRSFTAGTGSAFAIAGTTLGLLEAGGLRAVPLEGTGREASLACAGDEL
ncbi:MAG TPA: hypothetical protein VIV58_02445, partial [Kofleriaceae bacterium]